MIVSKYLFHALFYKFPFLSSVFLAAKEISLAKEILGFAYNRLSPFSIC